MRWWRRRGRGEPNLARYRKSAEHYHALHLEALREQTFEKRVEASWGLIARGSESIPYLQQLLRSPDPDSREDAAGAFEWLARTEPGIVEELLRALADETDHQPRDSIVLALGSLRDRRAVPALAELIRDERADGDTRAVAVESLGQVVGRRFDRQPDPLAAARAWLDAQAP